MSDKLSTLSFNKKIDLLNLINNYSIENEILNDKEFQKQLQTAFRNLSNKINNSVNSWTEPQFKDENNYWSQFKTY